jgi:hypothetical protein
LTREKTPEKFTDDIQKAVEKENAIYWAKIRIYEEELVVIGSTDGFIRLGGKNGRAVEIGYELNKMGGLKLMMDVATAVGRRIPNELRTLEFAWDGIGKWMC